MLSIANPLLTWFYENRRSLPFREDPTPYHIWISEIMLQQTRMTAVLPYYDRFIRELPTVADLAACDTDRLHKLWEGLGYYSRADNLKRAAEVICETYGGELPADHGALLALPGIGPYTAGAIASISFGIPAPAVDGNVMRVFSRLYNDRADITLGVTKSRVTERVTEEMPQDKAGDFNQALMELGALICVPGEPKCESCPLADLCSAFGAGTAASLPAKSPKKPRRIQPVTALLVRSPKGWLLQKRPPSGLLKNMWQPWTVEEETDAEALLHKMLPDAAIERELQPAKHIFSHIEWHIRAYLVTCEQAPDFPGFVWADDMHAYAIPNAFKAYKDILNT
ncbi:MAG: A/G-specific adenine glycosylase [Clostridia bacterium]|nr:A/G-specific adenine glycosylase [Clostridia bacterium]